MDHRPSNQNAAICDEIAYVMGFSKIFFDAFEIHSDRADEWQFLAFLLENEREFRVYTAELFDPEKNSQFLRFLQGIGPTTRDLVFKNLIAGLNEYETLVDLQRGKRADRSIVFTSKFVDVAKIYVDSFAAEMAKGKFNWRTNDPDTIMKYMKALIGFQRDQYYPAWSRCISQIAKIGLATKYSTAKAERNLQAAPCWALILTAWRYHLATQEFV